MDPIAQIQHCRSEARKALDPNADICFLALASKDGQASVRTLVLREIIANKFTLFINQTSPKWQLLAEQNHYELLLWYPSQQKQIRVNGSREFLVHDEVVEKWQGRPQGSKLLDYAYQKLPQSSAITSRQVLLDEINRIRPDLNKLAPPKQVTGVALVADRIEILDLHSEDRIHERRCYTLAAGEWSTQILVP